MGALMKYKGYRASVEYDNEDRLFVGKVHGISDSLNFHGQSVDELEEMFHKSIDNYLDLCKQIGKNPEKEYSGIFNVRIPTELHKKLAEEALEEDEPLNAKIIKIFEEHFAEREKTIFVYLPSYQIEHNKQFEEYESGTWKSLNMRSDFQWKQ